jgi:trans-2-enoyl-CoA reductase
MIELSIVSASTKREMDKPLKLINAINAQIAKAEHTKMVDEHKEKWIEQIFNTLKNEMETATDSVVHTFGCDDFVCPKNLYLKNEVLRDCFKIVAQLFEEMGYRTYFHEYCKGWKTRSGRFGWFGVYWG